MLLRGIITTAALLVLFGAASALLWKPRLALPPRMRSVLRDSYPLWSFLLYGVVAYYVLGRNIAVFVDGASPVPSLWWWGGRAPMPDMKEYMAHYDFYRALFLSQYLATSLAMTLLGALLTPWLVGRWRWSRERPFASSVALAWALLLLVWVTGDILSRHRISSVGTVGLASAGFLFRVTAPSALLSGVLALARKRLHPVEQKV